MKRFKFNDIAEGESEFIASTDPDVRKSISDAVRKANSRNRMKEFRWREHTHYPRNGQKIEGIIIQRVL